MEFSRLGEEVEIRLSERDAERLGVAFETFDCRDPQAQDVLRELVQIACLETGFYASENEMTVHLCRRRDGALSFFLRRHPRVGYYRFSDFASLLMAKRRGLFLGLTGSLYRIRDRFYLQSAASVRLLEYAEPLSQSAFRLATEGVTPSGEDWLFEKGRENEKAERAV